MNPPDDSAPQCSTTIDPSASTVAPSSSAQPPSGAENYVLGAEIARGGMGFILEAEDVKLKRTVAAKLMIFDSDCDESIKQRFLREAEVLALLSHPNIVPIHDIVWEAGVPLFYTMKRINGRTLQAILNDLRKEDAAALCDFTLDRLLLIFRKVCDALACAHSKGIIHRDLKPENIMIGEFGEVLVMDWGIAKRMKDDALAAAPSSFIPQPSSFDGTLQGSVMGTPQYMSPEQARGEIDALDERSDVFSLGGILYAILTLRPPVEGATLEDVLKKVASAQITPFPTSSSRSGDIPVADDAARAESAHSSGRMAGSARGEDRRRQECRRSVPAALAAVANKALSFDKAQRYQTVTELSADIEAYQAGFATKAEQAGLATQLVLLIKRNRGIFATAAAAWVLITALGVWFVINLRAKERRAVAGEQEAVEKGEAARRALARAQIALADSAFRNADLPGLVQALEACPADLRDQSWQYLAAKRDSSLRAVNFSADKNPADVLAVPGRPGQFVLAGNTPVVAIVDVAGGDRIVQTFDTGLRGGKALAISGDGHVLAVAGAKRRSKGDPVLVFDVATGARRTDLTPPIEPDVLALNHDGTRLAVAAKGARVRGGCALLDVAAGRTLWSFPGAFHQIAFSPDGQRVLALGSSGWRKFSLRRVEDGEEIGHLDANGSSQAVSPDGTRIAVATHEGDCYLLDGVTGAVLGRGRPHTGSIYSMAFTSDGHLLTSGDEGKFNDARWVFRLMEPEKFKTVGVFFGLPPGELTAWSLHPTSGDLLTAESPPRLWRLPVGREVVRLEHRGEQAWSGCFLSDTVVLARKNFELQRYDLSTPGRATELGQPFDYKSCGSHLMSGTFAVGLAPQPEGRTQMAPLKIFAIENGEPVQRLELKHEGRAVKLVFDAPGERLAAVGGSVDGRLRSDRSLEVFDAKSAQSLFKVPEQFEAAVFAGTARNLIALKRHARTAQETEDQLVVLDGATGAALRTVTNRFRVNALAASPDGQFIAIAGSDQSVHLLDAATLVEKSAFRAHDGEITALAFHPTKPIIATAAMDRTVKLWEHDTARQVGEFLGLGGTPVVLAFNPSGTLLLVDGQERTTRVFDVSGVGAATAK